MKYALNLAADGRILSATYKKYAPVGAVQVEELPKDNISDYLYMEGEYVYSPIPIEEVEEKCDTLENRVQDLEVSSAEMQEALEMILSGVTE